VSALTLPLLRDSDFQAAWYYSMVLFAAICLIAWALFQATRQLRRMWLLGDHGMAAVVAAVALVTFLMFASMLATVGVALWPATQSGGAT
jgi:ABC-type glucose/galactose transport system permease subunit